MKRRAALALAVTVAVALPAPIADAHRGHKKKRRRAPAAAVAPTPEVLSCIRRWESGGDYRAVSPRGRFLGAYQFSLPTWRGVTRRHWPHLTGVRPDRAHPIEQDGVAARLVEERGLQPWPTPRRRCG